MIRHILGTKRPHISQLLIWTLRRRGREIALRLVAPLHVHHGADMSHRQKRYGDALVFRRKLTQVGPLVSIDDGTSSREASEGRDQETRVKGKRSKFFPKNDADLR